MAELAEPKRELEKFEANTLSKNQFSASREIHRQRAAPDKRLKTGIWGPNLADWRDIVEDFVHIARIRYDNKLAMVQLQLNLLEYVGESQKNIKMFKEILKNPENMAKYTDDTAIIENPNLDDVERQKVREELLLSAFLDIGDSHMWRILKYDRPLLYIIGRHMSAGPMQYGPGLISELHGWGHSILNTDVSHFIINSITNFGRIGDLLSRQADGTIEVIEIKSKARGRGAHWKDRLERQDHVRMNFLSFANSGEGVIDNTSVRILESTVKLKTSLKILHSGLREADSAGVVIRKINPYMNVVILDFQILGEKDDQRAAKRAIDKAKNDWVIPSKNVLVLGSPDRQEFSPSRTPLSSMPFDDAFIADLLLHKKIILYSINIDILVDKFRQLDWELIPADVDPNDKAAMKEGPIWLLKKGKHAIGFPAIALNLLFYDTLSLSSLVDQMDEFVKGRSVEGGFFIRFVGEERVWR